MIEVEHLSKTYGSTAAIADVSFSVESGEILGFLGPNGAGKTTTMRILSGYLPASSGTARIAGLDIHEQSMAVRQRIGYLPENPPLYPEMTVEGFLFFVSRIKLVPAGDRARRVTSAIERCGLTEKRKVLIRKLSKGFRQRVGIAQAIVHDPPVIILDEPTVGLDPRQIIEVRNLIKSLAGQHTIILSTHILPEVSMTCSRVTIINRGKVVAAGSPERLTGELAADAGYELEIEGEGDDRVNNLLLPSLENLPGVRSIELIGEQLSIGRYRLRAVTESDAEPGREIAAAIVGSGFGLCEMRRTRASLEDVFLRLTEAEKKSDADLVHSEPEVDRNLQAESQKQESIADSQPSPSRSIAENLPVLERQELPYDPQPESEPLAETIESIELPQTEPISEISESGTISQAESAVSEISESIEQSPASSEAADFPESSQVEPVSEISESIEPPETISATADVREISQVEPVSETGESIEPSEAISETVDVRELPESEPVSEISESIELPESEPIAETSESIELPESEPIAETIESIELTQSTSELIVEDLEVKETLESSGEIQSEMQPVADFLQAVEIPDAIANYQSEAISEIIEPLEISQPEPISETIEPLEIHREISQPEPISETIEPLEIHQFEPILETSEPISETIEPLEIHQFEPVVERSEPMDRVRSESEPVAEKIDRTQLTQYEFVVVETTESIEPTQSEPSAETIEPPSNPIVAASESIEPTPTAPISGRKKVLSPEQKEAIRAARKRQMEKQQQQNNEGRSSEHEAILRQRQMRKKAQQNSDSQPAKNPQTEKKQPPASDSETPPPTTDAE